MREGLATLAYHFKDLSVLEAAANKMHLFFQVSRSLNGSHLPSLYNVIKRALLYYLRLRLDTNPYVTPCMKRYSMVKMELWAQWYRGHYKRTKQKSVKKFVVVSDSYW